MHIILKHILYFSIMLRFYTLMYTYIRWIMEKAREFQKDIYFCFIDYAKAFDTINCGKFWKRWE